MNGESANSAVRHGEYHTVLRDGRTYSTMFQKLKTFMMDGSSRMHQNDVCSSGN